MICADFARARGKSTAMLDLEKLKQKIEVFRDEVEYLIMFYEAWRPMLYDQSLLERMGTSRASQTFNVIRTALRREVVLGLTKLWDNHN